MYQTNEYNKGFRNYLPDRVRFTNLCALAVAAVETSQFLDTNVILTILKFWTAGIAVARRLTYTSDTQLVSNTISGQVTFHCMQCKTTSNIMKLLDKIICVYIYICFIQLLTCAYPIITFGRCRTLAIRRTV